MAFPALAERVEGIDDKPTPSNKRLKARCENASQQVDLDVNNVRARIMNGGDMWWDLVGSAKYEVPKIADGSNDPRRHSLFAGSIWIGGLNNGNIHTAAQTYRQFGGNDLWAGPVDTLSISITDSECEYWDRIFQVTREEIDEFILEFEENGSVAEVPDNIRDWPANGRKDKKESRFLAPYVNVGGSAGYDPSSGDYPDIKGDKALWFVYNDVGNLKTETGSPEIGLEFRTMAFAFATNDEINNMTFYETTIYNRGQKQLDSTFFGQWVDADLGYAFDDYVGCDIERGLGICYNGDNFDDGAFGYGSNPPSVGIDFFEGPIADAEVVFPGGTGDGIDNDGDGEIDENDDTYYEYYEALGYDEMPIIYEGDGVDNNRNGQIDEPNEDISMSKFVYYNNDFTTIGNPRSENRADFYNYLTAHWKNGDCIRFGGNGFTTATGGCTDFMFPDDPRDPDGWSEVTSNNQPGDRRFLQSAGPFTLKPGAVNTVTIGAVWARASSGGNTGSYDLLLLADDKAQKLFLNNFDLLDGPDAPDVTNVELDREIIIMLDREDYIETEEYEETELSTDGVPVTYGFQGYQLFQLANSQVSGDQLDDIDLAKEVWQVDLADGITKLVNKEFDVSVEENLPNVKVDGNDEGIEHVIRITDDAFASGNSQLINHKTYHYLLVAYASVDENGVNEDRQYLAGRRITKISVTPRQTDVLFDGTDLQAAYGDGPEIKRIEGAGTGGVFLDLKEETITEILDKGVVSQPTYAVGHGPVEIKVIDPLKVPVADFELRFVDPASEGDDDGKILLADISPFEDAIRQQKVVVSTQTGRVEQSFQNYTDTVNKLLNVQDSIKRIDSTLGTGTLSSSDSAFYQAAKLVLEREVVELQADTSELFRKYNNRLNKLNTEERKLGNQETRLTDNLAEAEQVRWVLTKTDENGSEEITAEKALYTDNEMVISEWGLSVRVGPEFGPGESIEDGTNGLIGSSVEFEDDAYEWLSAMPQIENTNDQIPYVFDWIRAGSSLNQDNTANPNIHDATFGSRADGDLGVLDEQSVYKSVANGLIAPYMLTSRTSEMSGFSTFGVCQSPTYGQECENFRILPSIDLVFTDDRTKWSRVLVVEMGEDPEFTEGNVEKFHIRDHASLELEPDGNGNPVYSNVSRGYSWFPGYAINVETGERLNIIMGENSSLKSKNAKDMIWNPTSQLTNPDIPLQLPGGAVVGGMHYIYVMGTDTRYEFGDDNDLSAYDECKTYAPYLAMGSNVQNFRGVWSDCMWVMPAMLNEGFELQSWSRGIVPTETKIKVRINRPYQTYATSENPQNGNLPLYTFNTGTIAPTFSADLGEDALDNIRVVPNPYYAQSAYETSQIDNYVKITNLPKKCTIKIYTVNGQLVKTFTKDETDDLHNTELLWDLKNDAEVPISSGAYIIHVEAELNSGGVSKTASTTVKFMAIIKPVDLDTF